MDANPPSAVDPAGEPHHHEDPALIDVLAPPERPKRFTGVLAALDRPLVLGFVTTLGVLGALVLGGALGSISTILVYIVLAMFLAVGLDPIVRMLERHRVKRGGAIAIVFGAFALLFAAFLIWVLPPVVAQIGEFIAAIPATIAGVPETDWFQSLARDTQLAILAALDELAAWVSSPATLGALGGGILAVGVAFVGGISASFIVVALTLYFLSSLSSMKRAFYALAPARNRARLEDLTERITASVGGALIGSVTLSSLNAAAVFLLHIFIGLPFPALMAVIAFVITLIPLFGSVIFLVIGTVRPLLLLPEGGAGLQPVHEEFGRREGRRPVRRGGGHEHDGVARHQPPVPVHHDGAQQRPARASLGHMALDLLFRHAGIMLQRERREPRPVRPRIGPAQAGEGHDAAHVGAPLREARRFGGRIERRLLDADGKHGSASGHGRKEGHFPYPGERGIRLHVAPVEGGAHHGCILEGIGVGLVPSGEPAGEIGDGGHLGGWRHLFLRQPDALAQPGEIKNLHRSSSTRWRAPARK